MKTDKRIEVIQGDITGIQADAIVNAANSSLLGGGGVDGAIHRAGGKEILEERIKIRNRQGGCPTGEAVITTAGNLPSRYVIHTVGPVWQDGKHGEDKLLAACYINSLRLAEEYGLQTIAFPNISTGVYHFPKPRAAGIAIKTVTEFLNNQKEHIITKVWFICYDKENYDSYKAILE